MLMANMSTYTPILSDQWIGNFYYVKAGDLVKVGPVNSNQIGIAIQRRKTSFDYGGDQWEVLVNGKLEVYEDYYIMPIRCYKLHHPKSLYNHPY